jgi:WD40 repeat protein
LYDKAMRLWRVSDFTLLATLEGQDYPRAGVAYSSGGQTMASVAADNKINLWRASDGSLLSTLEGHTDQIHSLVFSPDSQTLASGSFDRTVRLWRVSDGSMLYTLVGHTAEITSLIFSPDGQTLLTGAYDKTVRLWRVADGSLLYTLEEYVDENGRVFCSGGQTLVLKKDITVDLYRLADGTLLRNVPGFGLTISHDEQTVVTFDSRGTQLLQASDGTPLRTLEQPPADWTYRGTFSPGDQTLATVTNAGTVQLWQVSDGTLLRTLQLANGSENTITSVSFSSDGKTLDVALSYGRANLWHLK